MKLIEGSYVPASEDCSDKGASLQEREAETCCAPKTELVWVTCVQYPFVSLVVPNYKEEWLFC